jgi:hypothetical protein
MSTTMKVAGIALLIALLVVVPVTAQGSPHVLELLSWQTVGNTTEFEYKFTSGGPPASSHLVLEMCLDYPIDVVGWNSWSIHPLGDPSTGVVGLKIDDLMLEPGEMITFTVIVSGIVGSGPMNAAVKAGTQTIVIGSEGTGPACEPPLAVTLATFGASPSADHVLVSWETANEIDNRGFNLWRGSTPDAPSQQLNANLILSQAPGSAIGASYEYQDFDVAAGQTYYYWLEGVDLSGATQLNGPTSATFQAPTAVSLSQLQASNGSGNPILGWFVLAAVLAALASFALWRRQRLAQ